MRGSTVDYYCLDDDWLIDSLSVGIDMRMYSCLQTKSCFAEIYVPSYCQSYAVNDCQKAVQSLGRGEKNAPFQWLRSFSLPFCSC